MTSAQAQSLCCLCPEPGRSPHPSPKPLSSPRLPGATCGQPGVAAAVRAGHVRRGRYRIRRQHGRIIERFESPDGYVHLAGGTDGYVLCYRDPATGTHQRAFGFEHADHGFAMPRTKLRQTFLFHPEAGSLTVRMRVTNLSGTSVAGVSLQRRSDLDVDAFGGSGWFDDYGNAAFGLNWFGHDDRAVRAWNEPSDAPAGDCRQEAYRSRRAGEQRGVAN
jgi:hypothetical protein